MRGDISSRGGTPDRCRSAISGGGLSVHCWHACSRGEQILRFRLLAAAVTASAMATVVGASSASAVPIPPKLGTSPVGLMKSVAAPEPAGAVPTFVNGLSQAVFTSTRRDWVQGQVWVDSTFDSDGDGKLDRMHTDYVLPPETMTDGLKVPVIYEDSPYFAGTAANYSNWNVNHELGATPPTRAFAPFWTPRDTAVPTAGQDPRD